MSHNGSLMGRGRRYGLPGTSPTTSTPSPFNPVTPTLSITPSVLRLLVSERHGPLESRHSNPLKALLVDV